MPDHSTQGPFVQTAALFQTVLKEANGSLSFVRMIDTWTTTVTGPDAPEQMQPVMLACSYVLALKAGAARGRHTVTMELERPSGQTDRLGQFDARFQAAQTGVNLIVELQLLLEDEGVYWISSVLGTPGMEGGALLSRTPFEVAYQRRG
jgi:hypothetical protein